MMSVKEYMQKNAPQLVQKLQKLALQKRVRSPSRSPKKSRSRSKSPKASRSRSKSPKRSRSRSPKKMMKGKDAAKILASMKYRK